MGIMFILRMPVACELPPNAKIHDCIKSIILHAISEDFSISCGSFEKFTGSFITTVTISDITSAEKFERMLSQCDRNNNSDENIDPGTKLTIHFNGDAKTEICFDRFNRIFEEGKRVFNFA